MAVEKEAAPHVARSSSLPGEEAPPAVTAGSPRRAQAIGTN